MRHSAPKADALPSWATSGLYLNEDGVRFEPTVLVSTTVFKTVVINHSTNHPFGASGQTRTVDAWLRRPLLYPTELLRHSLCDTPDYTSICLQLRKRVRTKHMFLSSRHSSILWIQFDECLNLFVIKTNRFIWHMLYAVSEFFTSCLWWK